MNISHEHKVVWWASYKIDNIVFPTIFSYYNFQYKDKKNIKNVEFPLYSREMDLPDTYLDYKLICNIKNPYKIVYSIYHRHNTTTYTKKNKSHFRDNFIKYVNYIFLPNKLKVKLDSYSETEPLTRYYQSYSFEKKIPDFFIREENIKEDLQLIKFIDFEKIWDDRFLIKNLNSESFFDEMYDFETAKKVYFYFKKCFYLCGYDPFSFTKNELTYDEKVSFLHDVV